MKNPFWFNIIFQWKKKGMGEYGVTFPFLIGSIAHVNSIKITESFVKRIFREITTNPISGYYCEVRWCENIDEPVVSINNLNEIKNVVIKGKITDNKQNTSVAFTADLMSMTTLDCSTSTICIEKLIHRTLEETLKGNYYKNMGAFTPFTESDLQFINETYTL